MVYMSGTFVSESNKHFLLVGVIDLTSSSETVVSADNLGISYILPSNVFQYLIETSLPLPTMIPFFITSGNPCGSCM